MDETLEELLAIGRELDAAMEDALATIAEIDAEMMTAPTAQEIEQ